MNSKFEMVAKTFQGLETVLANELTEIGAEDVQIGRRMVSFTGDKAMLYKANFCCRTALRILKPFYSFTAVDADQLYEEVKKFDWEKVLNVNQTFSIDSVVYSEEFRHSKFVTYRVKDAIADFFNEKYGKRPSIRIQNADMMFNVHIAGDKVTISLDSSGESLHKRGYRVGQTEAPINEVLAAGLIKLSGWDGNSNLIDPMCGSGTFLIEAALIGANIYPGIYRNNFAFERWNDFDSEIFEALYNDDSQEREFNFKIYGSDISPKAIDIATKNIRNAGVAKYINLEVKPFQNIVAAPENGMLISNPPYGERLAVDDLENFYRKIGDTLKNVFKGYSAWLIGPKNETFDMIGLKPSLKFPILNGSLECDFRQYVIFEGRYNDFVKDGNTIKNDSFAKSDAPRRESNRSDRKFDRDRRSEGRRGEGKFGDRKERGDRRFDGKRRDDRKDDRRSFDGKRRDFDRRDRREDKDGERRIRPYGRRPEAAAPRNPLEERYRKPYSQRRDDKPSDGGRGRTSDAPRGEKLHGDEITDKFVKFRTPQLGKENERPIIHGRRNGWKRSEVEDKTDKSED